MDILGERAGRTQVRETGVNLTIEECRAHGMPAYRSPAHKGSWRYGYIAQMGKKPITANKYRETYRSGTSPYIIGLYWAWRDGWNAAADKPREVDRNHSGIAKGLRVAKAAEARGIRDDAEYDLIETEGELCSAEVAFERSKESCPDLEPEDLAAHRAAVTAGQTDLLSGVAE